MENQQFIAPTSSEYLCPCGRSFYQDSALTKHQRTCSKTKKRLSSALEKAKEVWRGKKRRRMSIHGSTEDLTATDLPLPGLLPTPVPVPVADEAEHFMEVCATIKPAVFILTTRVIAAYGTGWYQRFASHHDGTMTMDPANQP